MGTTTGLTAENPDVLQLSKLLSRSLNNGKQSRIKRSRAPRKSAPVNDPVKSAKEAGLRYMMDSKPGIKRIRSGKAFTYMDAENRRVTDAETLARMRSLAIPPAWTDVWICPIANGHLQATGRDARKRKQYRYHPRWKEVRDISKFDRMIAFGDSLPQIRDRVDRDLALSGLPREKVLATIVRLLEITLIRVGNEEYARENGSYGLTTMRNKHVQVYGSKVKFRFKGKSGKTHDVGLRNRRLARIIQKCQEIPGYELFQYVDGNQQYAGVDSSDVNQYLREISGQDFTAKDFRTWAATVLTAMALKLRADSLDGHKRTKKQLMNSICAVAHLLGNTPSVCRKAYIHPAVLDGYLDGSLLTAWEKRNDSGTPPGLATEEAIVLSYLRGMPARAN